MSDFDARDIGPSLQYKTIKSDHWLNLFLVFAFPVVSYVVGGNSWEERGVNVLTTLLTCLAVPFILNVRENMVVFVRRALVFEDLVEQTLKVHRALDKSHNVIDQLTTHIPIRSRRKVLRIWAKDNDVWIEFDNSGADPIEEQAKLLFCDIGADYKLARFGVFRVCNPAGTTNDCAVSHDVEPIFSAYYKDRGPAEAEPGHVVFALERTEADEPS